MWLVYAVAFVFGAGILLVQLLSGHGHDVGGGGHDFGHGASAGDHHPTTGPGLMSMRSISYGVFAFGFVGGALHVLGMAGPVAALVVGVLSGLAAALLAGLTFRNLADVEASGEAGLHEARGFPARVIVDCARGREGKVRLVLKGQTVDALATTDEESIAVGAEVVIVEVRDAVVHVASPERKNA
jgi:membrane protein implicated in regulation of membrane protease activity